MEFKILELKLENDSLDITLGIEANGETFFDRHINAKLPLPLSLEEFNELLEKHKKMAIGTFNHPKRKKQEV